MYQIERTSDVQSLLADPTAWDSLSEGMPMRESAWLGNWWKIYGKNREAYVVTVRDSDGTLAGLLPLYRLERNRDGRTLCGMGDGTTCTDHFSVLARQPDAAVIAAEIGRWLARISRDPRDGWDLIDLDGIVGGDSAAVALLESLRSAGSVSHATSRMSTWARATDDDWGSHIARLNNNDRRKSKRHRKILEQGDAPACRIASTKEEVHAGLDALIDMHQRRWTAVGEAGSYATTESRDFLHAVAQELFERAQLQLTWIEFDQRPIGSEFRIIGRDHVLYSYSTGMDRGFAKLEPGRILHVHGLLYAYEHGLRGINYMRGDEDYKQRMLATPRPLIHLRIAAPSLLPRLRHAAWRTNFELKQFIRRRTGRTVFRTLNLVTLHS